MKNNLSKILLAVVSLLVLLLIIPLNTWAHDNSKLMEQRHNSKMAPIIWIPGSSATEDRFDNTFKMIDGNKSTRSVLKLKVMENDKIQYTGNIRPDDTQPFIVVSFQDNKDGYTPVKKESRWLNVAFKALVNRYHFNQFSAVGHSNGGLVWSFFLENYYDSDTAHINRLMTIGSPYNSYETSINNRTVMLNDLISGRNKLPKDLIVYSVMGTENYTNDGVVPEASVEASKYVFQNKVKQFTQLTITGKDAEHSDLVTNSQVVELIEKYILITKHKPRMINETQEIKH